MKILILYASCGAGHQRAAEALLKEFQKNPSYQLQCLDALDYTSWWVKRIYQNTYTLLISNIPWLWGFLFWFFDITWIQGFIRCIRRINNAFIAKKLCDFLIQEQFDYIFLTHFLPNEVISFLKAKGRISSKAVCVVTDFDVHHFWIFPHLDCYTLATPWTRDRLIEKGIAKEKILVTGIPIHEDFLIQPDIKKLKNKLDLQENTFTVLIATGSFGIGPIEEIMEALKDNFQVVVICGNNKNLYTRLKLKENEKVKVFGLVKNMPEMMAVSNCMVTKPGGLSISEGLVKGLPFIFFHPIPGQEVNNIKVLANYGIGKRPNNIQEIVEELEKLRSSKDLFLTAVKKTQEIARPNAAKEIVKLVR